MGLYALIIGISITLFFIPALINPLLYWELEKLGLFMKGIKDAKPTKLRLIMIRIFALGGVIFGLYLIISAIFIMIES